MIAWCSVPVIRSFPPLVASWSSRGSPESDSRPAAGVVMCEPGSRGADTGSDPLDRMLKLAALKDQIARDQYAVDPDVVAEALIRRVRARRAGAPPVSRGDARSRSGR